MVQQSSFPEAGKNHCWKNFSHIKNSRSLLTGESFISSFFLYPHSYIGEHSSFTQKSMCFSYCALLWLCGSNNIYLEVDSWNPAFHPLDIHAHSLLDNRHHFYSTFMVPDAWWILYFTEEFLSPKQAFQKFYEKKYFDCSIIMRFLFSVNFTGSFFSCYR